MSSAEGSHYLDRLLYTRTAKLSASAVVILCIDLLIVPAVPISRLPLWLSHKLFLHAISCSQPINPAPFLGYLTLKNIVRQTCHDLYPPNGPIKNTISQSSAFSHYCHCPTVSYMCVSSTLVLFEILSFASGHTFWSWWICPALCCTWLGKRFLQ